MRVRCRDPEEAVLRLRCCGVLYGKSKLEARGLCCVLSTVPPLNSGACSPVLPAALLSPLPCLRFFRP